MPKVTIVLVEPDSKARRKKDFSKSRKCIDLRIVNDRQREYFREAYTDFLRGMDCWEFDKKYLSKGAGMPKLRELAPTWAGADIFRHLLYLALEELWVALCANQSHAANLVERTVYIVID